METHSSILAWRIPWTEEPGGLTIHGVAKELDTTEWLTLNVFWLIRSWRLIIYMNEKVTFVLILFSINNFCPQKVRNQFLMCSSYFKIIFVNCQRSVFKERN